MRKISQLQTLAFLLMLSVIVLITFYVVIGARKMIPEGEFRSLILAAAAFLTFYLSSAVVYRFFLKLCPLVEGSVIQGSRGEFAAQVNILFYLVIFNSLIRTHFVPVPLLRLVYLALGAKLGANTYSAGVLLDPPLTRFGENCIIGHNAVVFAHAIEGSQMALERVVAGDGVTIGAMAIVMAGVSIGDGAIVSAGAVVVKGTSIGPGEVWGGVPARRLK